MRNSDGQDTCGVSCRLTRPRQYEVPAILVFKTTTRYLLTYRVPFSIERTWTLRLRNPDLPGKEYRYEVASAQQRQKLSCLREAITSWCSIIRDDRIFACVLSVACAFMATRYSREASYTQRENGYHATLMTTRKTTLRFRDPKQVKTPREYRYEVAPAQNKMQSLSCFLPA